MMEDAGDVKFSVGFVETKAKLKVDINEAWRAMMEEKKGGTPFNTQYMCLIPHIGKYLIILSTIGVNTYIAY
jgi:hypothetical protein